MPMDERDEDEHEHQGERLDDDPAEPEEGLLVRIAIDFQTSTARSSRYATRFRTTVINWVAPPRPICRLRTPLRPVRTGRLMLGDPQRKRQNPAAHTLQKRRSRSQSTRAGNRRAGDPLHARYYGGTSWLADAARARQQEPPWPPRRGTPAGPGAAAPSLREAN